MYLYVQTTWLDFNEFIKYYIEIKRKFFGGNLSIWNCVGQVSCV